MFAAQPGRRCTARSMAAKSRWPTGSGAAPPCPAATAASRARSATPNCGSSPTGLVVSRAIHPLIMAFQRSRSAALAPPPSSATAASSRCPRWWSLCTIRFGSALCTPRLTARPETLSIISPSWRSGAYARSTLSWMIWRRGSVTSQREPRSRVKSRPRPSRRT